MPRTAKAGFNAIAKIGLRFFRILDVTDGDGVYQEFNREVFMINNIIKQFNGNDLKSQCARGSFKLSLGAVADRGLAFASKMLLVRLLMPREMGLMVLVISLTAMFEVFTEVGVKQSVIQHKNGSDPGYMNMAWWFQCVRAVMLYAIAFAATPWLCEFYFSGRAGIMNHHTMGELLLLVRIAFLVILFNGLISPAAHVLEKEFRFGKSILIIQGGDILGTVITIFLAFALRNVWAIVIGFCCMAMLKCVFSYVFCSFRPSFSFDGDSFKEIARYARGVFGSPVLAYLAYHLDVLVAGRLVAVDILGMYGMALVLARIPQDLFSRIITPVLLPAFAQIQKNREAMTRTILRVAKATSLLALPLAGLSIMCSKEILSVVYGESYVKVAVPFSLLCLYVLMLIQAKIFSNIFFGIGQPEKHRAFVGLRVMIIVLLIYPAIKLFGMTGAAFVLLFANFSALCLQVVILQKEIGLKVADYAGSWLPGLAICVVVMSVTGAMGAVRPSMSLLNLAAGILCMIILLGVLLICKSSRLVRQEETVETIIESAGESENV